MEILKELSFDSAMLRENLLTSTYFYQFVLVCIAVCLIYLHYVPWIMVYKMEDLGWISKGDFMQNKGKRHIGNLPPVYPNGWYALAIPSDLEDNKVLHVKALGKRFAVYRKENGEIKVLDACCPQLGANIGDRNGDTLQCPVHTHQYEEETEPLKEAPSNKKLTKEWSTTECDNSIYVWYHAEDEAPSWYPEKYEGLDKLTMHVSCEHYVNTHLQEIRENSADFAHLSTLHAHPALYGGDLRYFSNWPKLFCSQYSDVKFDNCQSSGKKYKSVTQMTQGTILFGMQFKALSNCLVNGMQEGPGIQYISFTLLVKTVIHTTYLPIEPLVIKLLHRIYAPSYSSLYVKLLLYKEILVNIERDSMVWNYKKHADKPVLSKEDRDIARFRRHFSQYYTENSLTYEKALEIENELKENVLM